MGRWSRTPELEAARRRPGALTASELRRAPEARCPSRRRIWSAHVLETDLVGTVTAGACTGRSTTGRTAPTTALRAWAAALEISAVRGSRPRDVPARTVSATPAPPADSGRTQRRSSVREVLWSHANPLCRSGDVCTARSLLTPVPRRPRWMQRQRREGLHWWTAGPSMSNSTRWCVSVPQESPGRRRVRP